MSTSSRPSGPFWRTTRPLPGLQEGLGVQIARRHLRRVERAVRPDRDVGDRGEAGPFVADRPVWGDLDDLGGAVGVGRRGLEADVGVALAVDGDAGRDQVPLREVGHRGDLSRRGDPQQLPADGLGQQQGVAGGLEIEQRAIGAVIGRR